MNGSAVVIGATGGIGRAMVERILADGAFDTVWAVSRSGTDVAGALGLAADLEDEASLASAAERIGMGPAPTLIVVATGVLHDGLQPERSFRQLDAEHLSRDYRVNAVGPALAAKNLLPLMPRDRRAVFAALSARVGSISDNRLGGWHSYRASKAALNMLMRGYAARPDSAGRPLLLLAPGWIRTALGGPDAPYTVEDSAPLLADLILAQSGRPGLRYLDRDGNTVPW